MKKQDVQHYAQANLPTQTGDFICHVYRVSDGVEHIALVKGSVAGGAGVLCRLHSECLTGEVFGSIKCDCKQQLDLALQKIGEAGQGVLLYLRQEGRGIGLGNKIRAYALQEQGMDTVDANRGLGFPDDARDYAVATKILKDLGVLSVKLMSNNPAKVDALNQAGIQVLERLEHVAPTSQEAMRYLRAKVDRMGHVVKT